MNDSLNKNLHRIVILGAGTSGLSAAYFALKAGYKNISIIERFDRIGGIRKTIHFKGEDFDLGIHRFCVNHSEESKQLFNEFIGQSYTEVKPSKLIQVGDVLFHHPIKTIDLANPETSYFLVRSGFSRYLKTNDLAKNEFDHRFDPWLRKNLSNVYYKKHFGLTIEKLSTHLRNQYKESKKEHVTHPVLMPKKGNYSPLWSNLAKFLYDAGVKFEFDADINNLAFKKDKVVSVSTAKATYDCDTLISSLPLEQLLQFYPHSQINASRLNYRASILAIIEVEAIKTKALYLTDYELNSAIGRIKFLSNWNKKSQTPVISVEIWCDKKDLIWKDSDELIINQINQHLVHNPLIQLKEDPAYKVLRIETSFPIQDLEYEKEVSNMKSQIEVFQNVKLIGKHVNIAWTNVNDSIDQAYMLFNN